MNKRIVILGEDEFLSDDADDLWELVQTLKDRGVKVEVIFTDDQGMTQGINAALI